MVFIEPSKYIEDDHFFYSAEDSLEKVCNAPKDKDGIFKVIELKNGRVHLIYLGHSDSGGLFNEIVNGLHHNNIPRKLALTNQLVKDKIHALDIYWFVTPKKKNPKEFLVEMLTEYHSVYSKLPRWNK